MAEETGKTDQEHIRRDIYVNVGREYERERKKDSRLIRSTYKVAQSPLGADPKGHPVGEGGLPGWWFTTRERGGGGRCH